MKDRQRKIRLFVPELASAAPQAQTGLELALPAAELHHALHVLRLRAGDGVEVFDGAGRRAAATVSRIGRNEAAVTVGDIVTVSARPSPAVNMAFALPKGERLDWLLEKAAELGAASLRPIVFERSLGGREELSDAKRGRWMAHCVSAAKQSCLDFLPELREPMDLAEFLLLPDNGLVLAGDLSAGACTMRQALASPAPLITLLVGPEGGLSVAELEQVRRAGVRLVRLGSTTLRIETAALALLAAVAVMQ